MKKYIILGSFLAAFSWTAFVQAEEATTSNPPAAETTTTTTTTTPTPTPSTSVQPRIHAVKARTQTYAPEQVKEIQKIVHDYLIKHPEVLIEASQALQAKEAVKTQQQSMQGINQNKERLFNDPNSPVAGNATGNVIIAEFFDYQCGHCKEMHGIIQALIQKNPNLKVIFKELPIFGGDSTFAAKAALAATKQDKFIAFHNALMTAENPLSKDKILSIARKVGIDVEKLSIDMKSPAVEAEIRHNFQLAQKLKLAGTPAFVLSNQSYSKFGFVPGSTSKADMQQQIDNVANNSTVQK